MSSTSPQLPKFLLIEDDVGDITLYRHALDVVGSPYEIHILQDGAAALDFVHQNWSSSSSKPCLIVLDLHLPKYDGLTVLKALRKAPSFSHVKVAVVTTNASPQEEEQLNALGVDLYRKKPRDLDEFLKIGEEIFQICQTEEMAA